METRPGVNAEPMTTAEIRTRLRLGLALVVGYLAGQSLRQAVGQHPSEFFVLGFGAGVILTQAAFWWHDRWLRRRPGGRRSP